MAINFTTGDGVTPRRLCILIRRLLARRTTGPDTGILSVGRENIPFAAVFEAAPIGLGLVDQEGRVLRANAAFRRLSADFAEGQLRAVAGECVFTGRIHESIELWPDLIVGERDHIAAVTPLCRRDGSAVLVGMQVVGILGSDSQFRCGLLMIENLPGYRSGKRVLWDTQGTSSGVDLTELNVELQSQLSELQQVERTLRGDQVQQAELLRRLLTVQEVERFRISRELHDQTGQLLTSLLIGLRNLDDASSFETARSQIATLRETTAKILDDVRALAFEIRPSSLDDLGLAAALEREADRLSNKFPFDVHCRVLIGGGQRLPEEIETAIYRVVNEAINNTARHARAKNVSVVIQDRGDRISAIIEDDGVGFDADAVLSAPVHRRFGLLGMEERIRLLGGEIRFESEPGSGVTISIDLPILRAEGVSQY